jgi:hypothetical protein
MSGFSSEEIAAFWERCEEPPAAAHELLQKSHFDIAASRA